MMPFRVADGRITADAFSASAKEKYAKNHTKTFKSMSADYAQKLGLADNLVTTRDDERELVVGGKED